jgi:hypothetical protein
MDPWLYTTLALLGPSLIAPWAFLRARALKRDVDSREQEFERARKEWSAQLTQLQETHRGLDARHRALRDRIAKSGMIRSLYQPVLLVGPTAVGKTSLLSHWRAPWQGVAPVAATSHHRQADVPVCDHQSVFEEAHFADDDMKVKAVTRMMLRVHDFPGEISAQKIVMRVLQEESKNLRQHSRREMGVVIVCMFDAGEVERGITEETRRYYNQELFRDLGRFVRGNTATIERLILVFNKADRLRESRRGAIPDEDLLGECEAVFLNAFPGFSDLCHPGRIIPVLTMLDRENNRIHSRGAPLVLGEAARALVESVMGSGLAKQVLTDQLRPVTAAHIAKRGRRAAGT